MTKQEHIRIIRKASANTFYDNVMIAFKSNKKLQRQQPNLLNELRFHRDNYYYLIDLQKDILNNKTSFSDDLKETFKYMEHFKKNK